MTIAILFWTAAPALACLSEGGMRAHGDCCAAMMQDCDASMSSSCCQLAPRSNTPGVASEYSPEHEQQPGLLWRTFLAASLTDLGTNQLALQSDFAPDPSPGHLSVLRI
jgi:hypothetical protein